MRIRTLSPGEVTLSVQAESRGLTVSDAWTLEARPLERIEVSQTQLPENARIELQLKPVDAQGGEVYAGAISATPAGAAQVTEDQRASVAVQTGDPGPATLEVKAASSTHLVPLQVGPDRRAAL